MAPLPPSFPPPASQRWPRRIKCPISRAAISAVVGVLLLVVPCDAATYHVQPDGDNANSGSAATASEAWRSVDRGQPAILLKDIKEGDTELELSKASQFPSKGTLLIGKDLRITLQIAPPRWLASTTPRMSAST